MIYGLFALGGLGLLARLLVLATSLGSNDMVTWRHFAEGIQQSSIGHLYDSDPQFNHPPLMGLFASLAYSLANLVGLRFEWLFKAPMLLADLGSALLLYQTHRAQSPRRAAAAFALFCCNPVSILITAYHGNTDSLCASLMLLAAVLMDSRRVFWSGVALAASINVKLIPVLLIPPLLACVRDRKQAAQFLGGLSLGVLPFLPYLIGHWQGFYKNALAYRSSGGVWGITFLAEQIRGLPHLHGSGHKLARFWIKKGSLFVLAWPLLLAALRRSTRPELSARELCATTMLAFLFLAPGFGVQYLVYAAGLTFAVSLGSGTWFTCVAGIHAYVLYVSMWTGSSPYFSEFRNGQPLGALIVGVCTWVVTGCILYYLMARPPAAQTLGSEYAR